MVIKNRSCSFTGIVLLLAVWVFWNLRDRHSGYEVDLNIAKVQIQPGTIMVGFAALPITPEIVDTWNDINERCQISGEGW